VSAFRPRYRAGWAGFHGPASVLPGRRDGFGRSARCKSLHAGNRGGDLTGPGPTAGEAEPQPPTAADDAPGAGKDPQARTPRSYAQADASPFPLHARQQITFDLQPTSVQFHSGDRIRIAIAAADLNSFQLLPANSNATYRISQGPASPSCVELPVIK
jgi:hypothetical protein